MNKLDKQKLVDEIQQRAHLLHKEGEDVIEIFNCTRSLTRKFVIDSARAIDELPELTVNRIMVVS